jgi:hypothetical protein
MNAGGRVEMYKLMDMEPPVVKVKKKKVVPKLKIDRTGESDPARYTGLKMGQVLDDDEMARALEEANRKKQKGEPLRPKLEEESFVKPFAGTHTETLYHMLFVKLADASHTALVV